MINSRIETQPASLAVVTSPSPLAIAALEEAGDAVRAFAQASMAASTRRGYTTDLEAFATWARPYNFATLPAEPATVALFLAESARTLKAGSVTRRAAAISSAHRSAGLPSPTVTEAVKRVLRGVRVTLGTRPAKKAAATLTELRAMLATLPANISGTRDRAMLLLGFFLAARRSELAGLLVEDAVSCREGLRVVIRRSKTDQEGAGHELPVPYHADPFACPVRALEAWKAEAGIESGFLFRSIDRHGNVSADGLTGEAVALTVQRAARRAGLDASTYAGHSLRAGFVTAAAEAGAPLDTIMVTSRHKSAAIALGYVRRATLFSGCAASYVR